MTHSPGIVWPGARHRSGQAEAAGERRNDVVHREAKDRNNDERDTDADRVGHRVAGFKGPRTRVVRLQQFEPDAGRGQKHRQQYQRHPTTQQQAEPEHAETPHDRVADLIELTGDIVSIDEVDVEASLAPLTEFRGKILGLKHQTRCPIGQTEQRDRECEDEKERHQQQIAERARHGVEGRRCRLSISVTPRGHSYVIEPGEAGLGMTALRKLVVGIDADDTLWHNENLFAEVQDRFHALLQPWADAPTVAAELLENERRSVPTYGYGVKPFTLSMIEVAIEVSGREISATDVLTIVRWGKELLEYPVDLIEGVESTIAALAADHRLILITKGDLHDQRRKIFESTLAPHFEGLEVVAEKDPPTYREILDRYVVDPEDFVMVGNSVRSDIAPVIALGGQAVHIPYHLTWALEEAHAMPEGATLPPSHHELTTILELPTLLDKLTGRTQ